MCVKLHVACAVRSVRRAHEAGFGRARAHVLMWGTPRNAGLALDAQCDVVAARMVGLRQEGNESLPDGAVREGTRCAKRKQLP